MVPSWMRRVHDPESNQESISRTVAELRQRNASQHPCRSADLQKKLPNFRSECLQVLLGNETRKTKPVHRRAKQFSSIYCIAHLERLESQSNLDGALQMLRTLPLIRISAFSLSPFAHDGVKPSAVDEIKRRRIDSLLAFAIPSICRSRIMAR